MEQQNLDKKLNEERDMERITGMAETVWEKAAVGTETKKTGRDSEENGRDSEESGRDLEESGRDSEESGGEQKNGRCKGISVRFLTSPILSHLLPVHMYFPSSLYYLQGPYL
jgi:hypothetical protein